MRLLRVLLPALALLGCSPLDPCEGLTLGQSAAGLPKQKMTALSGMYGYSQSRPSENQLNKGPVAQTLCCWSKSAGTTLDWCTPEQRSCGAEAEVYLLGKPYSYESPDGFDLYYCSIGVEAGSITAIWMRHYAG